MKFLVIGTVLITSSAAGWAQDWPSLDARTRALGGAGVAFADGRAESMYWNPASLAVGAEKPLDFSTGFAFSFSVYTDVHPVGNIISNVNHIVDEFDFYTFQSTQSNFNSATPTFTATDVENATRIIDSLAHLNDAGQGVLIGAGSSFDLRVGPFGLFVNALGRVGANPLVNFTGVALTTNPAAFYANLPPAGAMTPAATQLSAALLAAGAPSSADADNLAFRAQQALGDAAISDPAFRNAMVALVQGAATGSTTDLYNSPSGVFLRGLVQAEAGISFALPLLPTLLDVGVSFKEIISESTFEFVSFAQQDSGTDVGKTIKDDLRKNNRVRSTNFNMDFGARVMPFEWLTGGLAIRNLIPMDIKYAGPGKMHMDPQMRLGAMASALGFLKAGFDIELLENESPVLPGYKTQNFGAGLEFDIPVFKIRLGYAENLAFSQDHGRLTAGFGFDILGFVIDLGAQASLHKIEYQAAKLDGTKSSKTIPSDQAGVGITIGLNLPF